jgi:hypothetical protein
VTTKPPAPPAKAGPKAGAKKAGKLFVKGTSGNPVGMKPGTKHRRTLLIAAMTADDRAAIVEKIIRQAKRGCRASQRLIADRIEPARKARVNFKLLPIANVDDVVAAFDHVAAAVAQGVLTMDEAACACIIIEKTRDAIETKEIETRIAQLEQRMGTNHDEKL